jgi:hypothetical protein
MKAVAGTIVVVVLLVAFGASSRGDPGVASHDPARFASLLAALKSDEKQADWGLAGVATDIKTGVTASTGPCYNLLNNVNNDVVRRLDDDAGASALSDRNWLTGDIGQMEADIRTLTADLRDLENDRVRYLRSEAAAIAVLRIRIAATRATANGYISGVNADIREAYLLAGLYRTAHHCLAGDQIATPAVQVPGV